MSVVRLRYKSRLRFDLLGRSFFGSGLIKWRATFLDWRPSPDSSNCSAPRKAG